MHSSKEGGGELYASDHSTVGSDTVTSVSIFCPVLRNNAALVQHGLLWSALNLESEITGMYLLFAVYPK